MLYKILISSPAGHSVSSKHVMEDPGSTHNFVTHELAVELQQPSETSVARINLVGGRRCYTHESLQNAPVRHAMQKALSGCMDSLFAVSPAHEYLRASCAFKSRQIQKYIPHNRNAESLDKCR